MKKILLLIAFVIGSLALYSQEPDNNVMIGENLNLKAVVEIVLTSYSPQQIEERLNQENGINNLDLNGNGVQDYLKVVEYDYNNLRVYSIKDVLGENYEPEIVQVRINTIEQVITINGNSQYYGDNNFYQVYFSSDNFYLWGYLMRPPVYYVSPYHYGYWGYGYTPYRRVVPYRDYWYRPSMSSYRSIPRVYYTHPPRPGEAPRHFDMTPRQNFPPQHYNQPHNQPPQHFNQPRQAPPSQRQAPRQAPRQSQPHNPHNR